MVVFVGCCEGYGHNYNIVKSKKPEIEIIKFAVAGASKVRLRYDRILLYKCYANIKGL